MICFYDYLPIDFMAISNADLALLKAFTRDLIARPSGRQFMDCYTSN